MVNIIIKEIKDNGNKNIDSEVFELIENISKENIELKELVKTLSTTVHGLVDEVSVLKKSINNIQFTKHQVSSKTDTKNLDLTVTDVLNDLNKVKKQTKNTTKKPGPNSPYCPNKSLMKEYKNLELMDDGSIVNHGLRRDFKLPIGLNELLYFIEIEKDLTFNLANKLIKKYNIKKGTFGKIIYNIRDTHNFDNVLLKYKNNLSKAQFKVNGDVICINKLPTDISVSDAREWISLLVNASKKESKIIEIQEANPNFDKDIVRFICDSYNNPKLTNLLRNKTNNFIENNPSKRRNLIANGGIL